MELLELALEVEADHFVPLLDLVDMGLPEFKVLFYYFLLFQSTQ